MHLTSSALEPQRYRTLDALRGVAAAVVLLDHCYLTVPEFTCKWLYALSLTPLNVLLAGRFSVVIFFVISGFVLSLPFIASKNQRYLPYVARRFCRLYLPCFFALLVSWAIYAVCVRDGLGAWTQFVLSSWEIPIHSGMALRHFAMLGYPERSRSLDDPIWSLIVELRASIIFPLLVLLVCRFKWWAILSSIIFSIGAAKVAVIIGDSALYAAHTLLGSLLITAAYIAYFMFGIFTALRLTAIQRFLRTMPIWAHVGMVVIMVAATWAMTDLQLDHHGYSNLIDGIFAVYIVACSVTFDWPRRFLSRPICVWLGRVSFSLYLIHYPILLAASVFLPQALVLPVSVPLILLSAEIMQRYVEGPSVGLSRKIGLRVERWQARASLRPV